MSKANRKAALSALGAEVRGWQSDQEIFDATVAKLAGLNRTDWRCLDLLFSRGPMTAGQLAEAARLTTGAVTIVLDHLEQAGWVKRVRDTADRRKVFIETTEETRRRSAVVYGPFMKDTDAALRVFDAAQLELIADFVRRQRGVLAEHTARLRNLLATDGRLAARAARTGPRSTADR